MIRKVSFKNFGPFREAELELGPLTVIVGPNASGKTTVLDTILRLRSGGQTVEHLLRWRRRKGSASEPVEIRVETDDRAFEFRLVNDAIQPHERLPPGLPFVTLLRFDPGALRTASYVASEQPRMAANGYGLPTALANLKLADSDRFEALIEQARKIVPPFENVRFKRAKISQSGSDDLYGDELRFDMRGAPDLPASQVSDGTLFTLGILTSVNEHATSGERSEGAVVLIDELDRSLHPRALAELVGQLRAMTQTAQLQIVGTSHSPYLVDALRHEEVRITGFREDGSATIRDLSDAPEFERWKDVMSPGEIWSTVGEDWIR